MPDEQLRYARNGDVHLAYRVFGASGPFVIWVPGWVVGNVDTYDDAASPYGPLIEPFARETRFVVYDKRGAGLSDPVAHAPSLKLSASTISGPYAMPSRRTSRSSSAPVKGARSAFCSLRRTPTELTS